MAICFEWGQKKVLIVKNLLKTIFRSLYIVIACSFLPACDTTKTYQAVHKSDNILLSEPELKLLNHRHFERNPIIVIHGLLGGKLKDCESNDSIWGDFSWRKMNRDSYAAKLALPMQYGTPLEDIKSNAEVDGILDITTIAFRNTPLIYLESYEVLIKNLAKFGYYRPEKGNVNDQAILPPVYSFSYDWRRDISANVLELHKFIEEKERNLQKLYAERFGLENYNIKFDIVAHSMGGLLTRYYLQYGPQLLPADGSIPQRSKIGSDKIEKVIIVGTPNFGYVDTLAELHDGLVLYPGLKAIPPEIIGTFSSYYFMLPPYGTNSVVYADNREEVDIFDIELWKKYRWGLANDSEESDRILQLLLPQITEKSERRKIALEHLEKNLKKAKQFHAAMKKNMPIDRNTRLYLFAGNSFETNRCLVIDRRSGKIADKISASGDGKVTLSSALYDRRAFKNNRQLFMDSPIKWDAIYNCGASHMGIFSSQEFWANLSLVLLSEGTSRQKKMEYQNLDK